MVEGQREEPLARIPQDDVSKHDIFFLLKFTPILSIFLSLLIIYSAFIDTHTRGAPVVIVIWVALIVFFTVITEWGYYAVMKAAAPVNLLTSSVEFEPPALHKGRIVGVPRYISKEQITKIELVRDKAKLKGTIAGPLPIESISALIFYTTDGKKASIVNDHPYDLQKMASLIQEGWMIPLEDPSINFEPKAFPAGDVLINNPTKRPTKRSIEFFGFFFMLLSLFFFLFFQRILNGNYEFFDVQVCVMIGCAYAAFLIIIWLMRVRNIDIRSIEIQKEGINIRFRKKIELYRWRDIGGVTILPSDRFKAGEEMYGLLALRGKPMAYIITVEVGRAIEGAYKENTGRISPSAIRK